MNLLQFFRCVCGKHLRSRGHAREYGGTFRSKCVGCGKPMIRTVNGWQLAGTDTKEQ